MSRPNASSSPVRKEKKRGRKVKKKPFGWSLLHNPLFYTTHAHTRCPIIEQNWTFFFIQCQQNVYFLFSWKFPFFPLIVSFPFLFSYDFWITNERRISNFSFSFLVASNRYFERGVRFSENLFTGNDVK